MKRAFFHLLLTAFATTTVFARDTIVFKNGDVLSGTIIKQNEQHVYFRSSSFGSVSLSTRDIAEIRNASDTEEKTVLAAPPPAQTTPTPVPEKKPPPPKKKVIAPQVAKTEPAAPPLAPKKKKKRWTGQTGLEVAMREKNTTRLSNNTIINRTESYETYRVYGNVNWKGEKNNLKWSWTYRYSQDETRKRDDFANVTQKYNHSFPKGFYYAEAKTVYQRDYNRQIENEFLQTAEIGRKWFDRPKLTLSTSFGGGYHQFDRISAGSSIRTQEPKFIIDQTIRWKMINSLTLFQKYTHLGDLEKYHFIFTAGLENKLIHDVFLRLEYRLDRDTEVRYDDKGFYDKALRTSLLYKF